MRLVLNAEETAFYDKIEKGIPGEFLSDPDRTYIQLEDLNYSEKGIYYKFNCIGLVKTWYDNHIEGNYIEINYNNFFDTMNITFTHPEEVLPILFDRPD